MINLHGIEDLHDTDTIEIKAVKLKDGTYRVWVNGPNGLLFRAYKHYRQP